MDAIENATILLVEDHRTLAATVTEYMESQGYTMDYAADGLSALELVRQSSYDAIILDVMLPHIDGFQVCTQLRQELQLTTPIIMLTARDQLTDKLTGFEHGADDYLVKPFELQELSVRVNALIRRQRGLLTDAEERLHDLTLNPRTMEVRRAGQTIKLSPTCFRILKILLRESPHVVSREDLERELWGDLLPDSDTLRSHLYNLRKAVDKPFDTPLLHTLPGLGFKIAAPKD